MSVCLYIPQKEMGQSLSRCMALDSSLVRLTNTSPVYFSVFFGDEVGVKSSISQTRASCATLLVSRPRPPLPWSWLVPMSIPFYGEWRQWHWSTDLITCTGWDCMRFMNDMPRRPALALCFCKHCLYLLVLIYNQKVAKGSRLPSAFLLRFLTVSKNAVLSGIALSW